MTSATKQFIVTNALSLVVWIFTAGMLFQRVSDLEKQLTRIEVRLDTTILGKKVAANDYSSNSFSFSHLSASEYRPVGSFYFAFWNCRDGFDNWKFSSYDNRKRLDCAQGSSGITSLDCCARSNFRKETP